RDWSLRVHPATDPNQHDSSGERNDGDRDRERLVPGTRGELVRPQTAAGTRGKVQAEGERLAAEEDEPGCYRDGRRTYPSRHYLVVRTWDARGKRLSVRRQQWLHTLRMDVSMPPAIGALPRHRARLIAA